MKTPERRVIAAKAGMTVQRAALQHFHGCSPALAAALLAWSTIH
ncbi:hypothetical protein [Hydrocarboniphaga sp.]